MNISVRKVDLTKLDKDELAGIQRVLDSSQAATIFHTPEWNRLLIEYFNLPYTALLASDGNAVLGLHLFFHHSDQTYRSPAIEWQSVYGGPVALNDDPLIIQALLQEAERVCPIAYFQVWTSPRTDLSPFLQSRYSSEQMWTPIMDLSLPEEERWKKLHKDKRYQTRKALNAGLEIREANIDDLESYHAMVAETLARAGLAPLPLGFLRAVLERLSHLGMARLFVATLMQETISGTIILYHKDTAYGWDIGWRREYSGLSPNDFLIWEVTKQASRDGFRHFDLLRIEPDRLPGIAKWKETFGCEIVPCHLLRKSTTAYRLLRPVTIAFTQPRRVIQKVRSMVKLQP